MGNLGYVTHYNHKNICRGTSEWGKTPAIANVLVEGRVIGQMKAIQFEGGSSHQNTRDFNTLEEMNNALVDRINEVVKEDDILVHLGDWSFGGKESIWEFRKRINCQNIHLIYGNHDHHIERNRDGAQGLFKSVQHYKEIEINKTKVILLHFSMRVWNKSHKGAIHLYGHSHGSLPNFGRSMDVGVDTNNLYPYDLEKLVEKLKQIPVEIVDHHNSKTN